MIPISLTISGFLSYHEPTELDFTRIDLACISGSNGAGKSSLLDAITWALFGQARKRDESLINSHAKSAEVSLSFQYEGNVYKVQRTLPRGKTSLLEFHIQQPGGEDRLSWRPLTEPTLRATQARIESTLRLDYDTFVNASFFLQGKADQFTQQRPADRKRILSSILGLEKWEDYRAGAAERRKALEAHMATLDGRLSEIAAELAEEDTRKAYLATLTLQYSAIVQARQSHEKTLDSVRQMAASLNEQRKLVDSLARQTENSTRRLEDLTARLDLRRQEKDTLTGTIGRADEIEAAYQQWNRARQALAAWEATAEQFREHEKRRQPYLDEINTAQAKLEQEQQTLLHEQSKAETARAELFSFELQRTSLQQSLQAIETRLRQRTELETALADARQRQSDARAENPRLKAEMDELKARIDRLQAADGAACPLCGRPLDEADRQQHIVGLGEQGKALGDRYRANQTLLRDVAQQLTEYASRVAELSQLDVERLALSQSEAALSARIEQAQQVLTAWEEAGALRLEEITRQLQQATFNLPTRQRLAALDAELAALGYDAAAHDEARQCERQGRASEDERRTLELAQAALAPLEREINELRTAQATQQEEQNHLQAEHAAAASALAAAEASSPDLYAAERELLSLKEQENRLALEVGAAQQRVTVLDDLRIRRKALTAEREQHARQVGYYKQLERAFGKDGVPALLIEQALPQIQEQANKLLERLTNGGMQVSFATQAAYKDKKRQDLKETLDIQISDSAGTRDYEMFSGGEAFRVNFAIRLALSEVLAQRAGARLQTLVIDEGFGSQDALGRQRLIEAINLVKPDFAKILVITHIDELKDAFPVRIEVEKTAQGSTIRVV
ncbi:MAG: AAA family ATPase [Chloroflexota bacterium]